MAKREVKEWITVNGVHIPIFDGQSKDAAVKQYMNHDEKQKDTQIKKNKEQANRLNNERLINKYKKDYNINIDDSYFINNNDVKFLQESTKVLDKIYKDMPIIKELELRILSKDFSELSKKYADAKALSERDFSGNIYLNSKKFQDFNELSKDYEIADNKYPKGTTAASILAHELGHKIEYLIAKNQNIPEKELSKHLTAKAIIETAYNNMPKNMFKNISEARESISKYANTNYSILFDNDLPAYEETLAEAVSDYYSNDNKSTIFSKYIVDYMKKLLK